jgi:hypothetical protein
LHGAVKYDALRGPAQLPRIPNWRSSQNSSSTHFGE